MSATKPYTPTPIVEIAFVDRTTVPGLSQWIDVSDDCFKAKTTRGRTSEFDNFNAGTLTLGLYNDDRKYDPLYASAVDPSLADGEAVVKLLAEFDDPITLFSDNFASALASFWEDPNGAVAAGAVHVSSNKLVGLGGFFLRTNSFEASRSITTVEMVQTGNGTDPVYFGLCSESDTLHSSGATYARFRQLTVNLTMTTLAGGNTDTTSITYDSTAHRWLQIEVTGTSVIYRTSPDGSTWTTRATHSTANVIANLPTQLKAFVEDAWFDSHGGQHSNWDNFSVTSTRLPIWYGAVESFNIKYEEGGTASEVDLNAVDHIDYLSDYVFPNTLRTWVEDSTIDYPDDWIPFDKFVGSGEGFENERFANVGATPSNGDVKQYVKLEVAAGVHPSSLGSVKFPSVTPLELDRTHVAYRGFPDMSDIAYTTQMAISLWVQFDEPGTFQDAIEGDYYEIFLSGRGYPDYGPWHAVGVNPVTGAPHGFSWGGGGLFVEAIAVGVTLFDGKPHHLFYQRNGTSGTLYLDGVLVASKSTPGATSVENPNYESLGVTPTNFGGVSQSPVYRVSDLMIWQNSVVLASEVKSLYERMRDGWIDTVLAGEAIDAVLDEMGWPLDFRSIDEGTVYVQLPKELEGQNALNLLQRIAASEQGRIFVDEMGRVVFHDHARQFNNPLETTSQYSFTDIDRDTNPSDVGIVDESLSVALDDEFKITRAEVTRTGGTTQVAETGDGRFTRQINDLFLTADVLSLNVAEALVFRNSVSKPRADAWTVTPEVFTDDWTTILEKLHIGTRVDMEFTPSSLGDPITLNLILGMENHEIDDEEWIIKYHGTPADDSAYAIWDDGNVGWDEGVWA